MKGFIVVMKKYVYRNRFEKKKQKLQNLLYIKKNDFNKNILNSDILKNETLGEIFNMKRR